MPNEVAAKDPLGNTIYLLQGIFFAENEEKGIYDDATAVIKKPAILIETGEGDQKELFYFRSIGWNKTLLLVVRWNNKRWEAYNCIKNPPSETLSAILKKGKQII